MSVPTACLAERETANSVRMNGIAISLSKISGESGIDIGYLSRIFSGRSKGSAQTVRVIARCLGMSVENFMDSLPCSKYPKK